MSEETTTPAGLLTSAERDILLDETESEAARNVVRERAQERVRATLRDLEALYRGLRDEDIAAMFDDKSERPAQVLFHNALVFLFYSMIQTNQQLEPCIERAVQHAYAATDHHASIQFDIVTEPFLPPQRRLDAVSTEGFNRVSLDAFERLFYDDSVPPEAFDDVASENSIVPSADEVRQIREETAHLERVPLSFVLDVEVTTVDSSTEREDR
jgi:hypothetical protein